ncbi:hypothetical protein MMC13_004081 [Lambiella insularis]|nr:hypothetical protein [Lambiella insularis]
MPIVYHCSESLCLNSINLLSCENFRNFSTTPPPTFNASRYHGELTKQSPALGDVHKRRRPNGRRERPCAHQEQHLNAVGQDSVLTPVHEPPRPATPLRDIHNRNRSNAKREQPPAYQKQQWVYQISRRPVPAQSEARDQSITPLGGIHNSHRPNILKRKPLPQPVE